MALYPYRYLLATHTTPDPWVSWLSDQVSIGIDGSTDPSAVDVQLVAIADLAGGEAGFHLTVGMGALTPAGALGYPSPFDSIGANGSDQASFPASTPLVAGAVKFFVAPASGDVHVMPSGTVSFYAYSTHPLLIS